MLETLLEQGVQKCTEYHCILKVSHKHLLPSPQSTNIPRVPQCLSPRLTDPPPLPQASAVSPRNRRGGHSCLWVKGWGVEYQFGRMEKKPRTLSTFIYDCMCVM
jgi:hypothetical protein